MLSASTSYWLYSSSMKTYMGSAKYEYVHSFFSSTITSNFSSALYTDSLAEPLSKFLNLSLTTAAFRPDLLYSAFRTTSGWSSTMITFPTRNSCAVFILQSTPEVDLLQLHFYRTGAVRTKLAILPAAGFFRAKRQ